MKAARGLAAAALLAWAGTGWGWSDYGHQVVGDLAMLDLSPATREAVGDLLDDQTLAEAATWADEVRPDRPETAPLHYINGPPDRLQPRPEDYALERGNVYSAILGYAARLADGNLPREDRVEALRFLAHFVGDLHQPLHCGFAEDRGGNDFRVYYLGEESSLHRYWDHHVLAPRMAAYHPAQLAAILHDRHGPRERALWIARTDPRDWVLESRAYVFGGLYPLPQTDGHAAEAAVAVLDKAYGEAWRPVAERQLARAGARLARLLNHIFETGQSPFEPPPIPFPPKPVP